MNVKRQKFAAAVTLIEVILAMSALVIATLGALSYQYHIAIHSRIAKAQVTGMRTAQLLLEDWMSTGGSDEYDLSVLGLGFSTGHPIPGEWSDDDELGSAVDDSAASITVDGLPMLVTLRWLDVAEDASAEVTLRQLSVIVRYGNIDDDTNMAYAQGYLVNMRPIIMTTYIRLDASV